MAKIPVAAAVLSVFALAPPALVAAGQGVTVGGVAAATSMQSETEVSGAGVIGYRVNRFIGFGMEVMSVPTLKPDVTAVDPSTLIASSGGTVVVTDPSRPTSTVAGTDGRIIVFATNVRIDIPTRSARVMPYVVGGGGVASVKERFAVTAPAPPSGIPVVLPPQSVTLASTDMVLTVGGGVSTLIAAHVSIDVDLRYLRLMAAHDLNIGRFGVGLSYHF